MHGFLCFLYLGWCFACMCVHVRELDLLIWVLGIKIPVVWKSSHGLTCVNIHTCTHTEPWTHECVHSQEHCRTPRVCSLLSFSFFSLSITDCSTLSC